MTFGARFQWLLRVLVVFPFLWGWGIYLLYFVMPEVLCFVLMLPFQLVYFGIPMAVFGDAHFEGHLGIAPNDLIGWLLVLLFYGGLALLFALLPVGDKSTPSADEQ